MSCKCKVRLKKRTHRLWTDGRQLGTSQFLRYLQCCKRKATCKYTWRNWSCREHKFQLDVIGPNREFAQIQTYWSLAHEKMFGYQYYCKLQISCDRKIVQLCSSFRTIPRKRTAAQWESRMQSRFQFQDLKKFSTSISKHWIWRTLHGTYC